MKKHFYGGVYITNGNGALVLKDAMGTEGADQTIVDQSLANQATLFLTMYEKTIAGALVPSSVKHGQIEYVNVGYVDTVGVDQLTNVRFLNHSLADLYRQREKLIYQTGALAEDLSFLNKSTDGLPAPVDLETQGKLWFLTEWGTIINVSEAGEYFYLVVSMTDER